MPDLWPPAVAPLAAPAAGRGPASPKNTWSSYEPPSRPIHILASASERACPRPQACPSHASRYTVTSCNSVEQKVRICGTGVFRVSEIVGSIQIGIIFICGIGYWCCSKIIHTCTPRTQLHTDAYLCCKTFCTVVCYH